MREGRIPVVFATDDLFVIPTYVAMWSMMKNSSINYFYDIYVMHSGELSENNQDFIGQLSKCYNNCKVHFLYIDDKEFVQLHLKEGITVSSVYRLLLCDYMTKYDKCLYIDADVIILGDISELYKVPMEEKYIGAVKDGGVQYYCEENRSYASVIGINDMRDYVNSGILVMNLAKMREVHLQDEFLAHITEKYKYLDQDILNKCCQGKIQYLPLKYNIFRRFYGKLSMLIGTDFNWQQLEEAERWPVVIHYAEGLKPWDNIKSKGSDIWWAYARRALGQNGYHDFRKKAEMKTEEYSWRCVCKQLNSYQRVVIFGYSQYGRTIYNILHNYGIKNIVAFCDNDIEKQGKKLEGIEVKSLDEIKDSYGDVFWINASQKQEIQVKELLLKKGFKEESIWHYNHQAYTNKKGSLYYALLEPKYYFTELQEIIIREVGIRMEYWDDMICFIKENKWIAEKYYMKLWALGEQYEYSV